MKALKIVGIAAVALVVVLGGAIAVVASRFDADSVKRELVKVVQDKKQRHLAIDGELKLSFWPNLGIALGKVSLSEPRSDQVFATVDKARVAVAVLPLLSKRIVVNTVELDGATATLIKHRDGTLNIDDLLAKGASAPSTSAPPPLHLDIAGVKVANAQLVWRDEKSGSSTSISGLDLDTGRVQADSSRQVFEIEALKLAAKGQLDADHFEFKLDVPKLALAPEKSAAGNATIAATLTGAERNANVKLALAGIEGSARAFRIAKLGLTLDAKAGASSIEGTLESPLSADLARRSVALEQISGSFDIADARMPARHVKLPLSGTLHADLARQSAGGNLATQFDESKIALKLDVEKFAPPTLAVALDIDRLNVDKYLPPPKAGAGAGENGGGKLDFSALKRFNLAGTVNIGRLQVHNVKAQNIKAQIKLADGRLNVAPQAANLYGGTVNGALALDANSNAVTVKENLAGVDINPLLKDAAGKDLIAGRGSVVLDVATHGETVAAMKKALSGSASLALKDGALKGINLAQSLRELKAKFSTRQDAVQQAKATDKTDFSELSASFKIANGVAHNQDLAVKSPFLRLAGSGDIDIGNGTMNYLAKASVVATAGGQGAADLAHLKGLTVPVRASGPFDKLSYRIEFAGLASEAVKAKVEEQTQAVKQKAQNKLKSLFGR
ncbi:MAG: AsmA family protein [Rhodocyclaceae bacterium]|nr:AsmA family protein [Rhodocyclaceae bacterium]